MGKMIVISAPSGSGKTSIVKQVLAADLNLAFSVSACSRAPRQGEVDGRDYYFLTPEAFRQKIDAADFIEWEEVYPGSYYGTLRSEVERIWSQGRHVIFDVDVLGGLNIKRQYGTKCLAIFIKAPSVAELEKRLRLRATDDEATIRERVLKADYELTFAPEFDAIVVNNDLSTAIEETRRIILEFLES
ncbi:MAG TPA: guanylate kinase [Bacteroidales bacterium]|nr:guanylate kinase [Bacteroidales bacterium]